MCIRDRHSTKDYKSISNTTNKTLLNLYIGKLHTSTQLEDDTKNIDQNIT